MYRYAGFVPAEQKGQPLAHAAPGLGRHAQDFDSQAHGLEISRGRGPIEVHRIRQVDLGDYRDIGAIDDGGGT
jgi:hypothetical protein